MPRTNRTRESTSATNACVVEPAWARATEGILMAELDQSSTSGAGNARPDPVRQLEQEWHSLLRTTLRTGFVRWQPSEPALARFASAESLLAFLHDERRRGGEDALLLALLRLATEERLAGRVVLQALLPGLKRIAGRLLRDAHERAELWELLLGHCWERICVYPVERRPRSVAANLLLDTLHATLRELEQTRKRRAELTDLSRAPAPAVERDVEQPLRAAVAAGAISEHEAELILRVRIDGDPIGVVAEGFGVSYDAARVRLQRAERRLLLFLGVPVVPRRRPRRPSLPASTDQQPRRVGETEHASRTRR
jgi:DNA-directed RNA polymerase specialized sigma24 family protein